MGLEKWADLVPKKKFLLSEESALAALGKLTAYYETDLDDVSPDQEPAINQIFSRLVTAFRQGKIDLSEDAEKGLSIIQHIKTTNGKDTLTYRELRGSDKTKLETAGSDPTRRMHTLCGLLCGLGVDVIQKLPSGDLRVTEALAGFFLVLA
jgi:hypothetical protein